MGIQRDKLERSLGGIAEMIKVPEIIFIIDTNIEELAVKEAQKLNIPIVAIVDTNSNPVGIDYPIPGNDDARRAINLYCDLIKQTVLDAQQNVPIISEEDLQNEKKIETPKENEKKIVQNKVPTETKTIKVVKKISGSIVSKVKSLASKATKKI
jgi:small subunit ribosomal protein S2